ncbi:hypothetical protein H0H92_005816 [Tricholoma furcatifolium]|nr:hypothetical protein H0H92_005816 [Tricholoma furcatifolium]
MLNAYVSGIGSQMWIVVLGRAVSGMGGAGIMTVGSVIITDIVPKRDVAIWRAYVNISMTLGRGVGGPLGGWLTDTIGWRWSFILQAPLVALAALLVVFKLLPGLVTPGDSVSEGHASKLRQVDLLGSGLLGTAMISIITLLDQGGKTFPWRSWWALLMGGGGVALFVAFVVVEAYIAQQPIFDLRILRRTNVSTSYIIGTLQVSAQVAMMFSIPLYFQVTQRVSTAVAGSHLVPAVVGNTVGAMLAGIFIKRTGYYKILLILAGLVASVAYSLLYLRWNGNTGFWESMYIIPGGMGTGISAAASFVAMTALLPPEEVAMATSGFMLLFNFGITIGVTTSNAVLGVEFQRQLQHNLHGPGTEEVAYGRS